MCEKKIHHLITRKQTFNAICLVYKRPLLFSGSQLGKWSWSCNGGSRKDETLNPSESLALGAGFFFSSSTGGDEEDDKDLWPPKSTSKPMQNPRSLSEVDLDEAEGLIIFECFSKKENCFLVLSPRDNASSISYEENKVVERTWKRERRSEQEDLFWPMEWWHEVKPHLFISKFNVI